MKALLVITVIALSCLVNAQDLRTFTSNGLYGFKHGNEVVIPAKFNYAADFSSGLAAVMINKKWGFIDLKGNLVVPTKYEKVESFNGGLARFYIGKKMGLLDSLGKEIVPAICDEIYKNWKYWSLKNGGLQGMYLSEAKSVIEPKYVYFTTYLNFILAKKTATTYDIYNGKGKLLGVDVRYPIAEANYRTEVCDLNWGDSTFMIDPEGNRLTKTYRFITSRYCNYTSTNEVDKTTTTHQQIYLLNLDDPNSFFDPETGEEISNRFHIYFEDGRVLDDAVYSDYKVEDDDHVSVKRNGLLCNISFSGELIPTKYIEKFRFHEYSLLYLPDSSVDVVVLPEDASYNLYDRVEIGRWTNAESDTILVGHFNNATVPYQENVNPYYNPDYYNPDYDIHMGLTTYGPTPFGILEIEGEGADKGKFALYDLNKRKFFTNFDKYHKILDEMTNEENPTYIFRNEAGVFAFSHFGFQSPYKFSSYRNISGFGHTLTDSTEASVFIPTGKDTVIQLPTGVYVFNGQLANSLSEELVVDPETGEEYYTQVSNGFPFDFVLLQTGGETPKYGYINGKTVSLPKYDEFLPPNNVPYGMYNTQYPFLVSRIGEQYGAVDLLLDYELQPMFDRVPEFSYTSEMNALYTIPIDKEYYVSSKGKVFTTQNPEVIVYSAKGKKGFLGINDFNGNYDTLVQPLYKTLVPVIDVPFAVAGNKEKRKGLISYLGDTIIPFIYDDIQWKPEFEYLGSYAWFTTFLDGKQGLYNAESRKGIPANFDGIDEVVYPTDESQVAFIVRNAGKCGMYSSRFTELIPCDKVGIDVFQTGYTSLIVTEETNRVGSTVLSGEWYFYEQGPSYWFDYIVGDYGYRKNENGYSVHQIMNNLEVGQVDKITLMFEDKSSDAMYTEEELYPYEIFMENDRMGLRERESKKVLVKPTMRYLRMPDSDYYIQFLEGETFISSIYSKKVQYKPNEW